MKAQKNVIVHLGRRMNVLTFFVAFLTLGAVLGTVAGALSVPHARSRSSGPRLSRATKLLVLGGVDSSLLVIGLGIYVYYRKRFLRVDSERVAIQIPSGTTTVPISHISRLSFFRQSWLISNYTIETREGELVRIHVLGKPTMPHFQEALDYLEELTGLTWLGMRAKTSLKDLGPALRQAIGARSRGELALWIFKKSLLVQGSDAGMNDPLMRWGYYSLKFGLSLIVLCVEAALLLRVSGRSLTPVLLLVWLFVNLGVNTILVLFRAQVRTREGLETELSAAREVQRQLLPLADPQFRGFDISGICVPARDVGGDYFDFLALGRERLAVTIADVSGKGLPAALLMTLTKGALSTSLGLTEDLRRALSSVNTTVRSCSAQKLFVSMALVILDAEERSAELLRAGHNPPLLFDASNGTLRWLKPAGIALGLQREVVFERQCQSEKVTLDSGDVLVLYTDGLTEAMNLASEEYGEERFAEIVKHNRNTPASEMKAAILADVDAFRGEATASDDLTLVVVRLV